MELKQIQHKYPVSYKFLTDHIFEGKSWFYRITSRDVEEVASQLKEPTWMIMESLLKDAQMVEEGYGGTTTLWEVEDHGRRCCNLLYTPSGFKLNRRSYGGQTMYLEEPTGWDYIEEEWLVKSITKLCEAYRDIEEVTRSRDLQIKNDKKREQLISAFTGKEDEQVCKPPKFKVGDMVSFTTTFTGEIIVGAVIESTYSLGWIYHISYNSCYYHIREEDLTAN